MADVRGESMADDFVWDDIIWNDMIQECPPWNENGELPDEEDLDD